ncbi:glutamine synthetase III [candidate division KSB1 bacterium]|nr:glutamine synthetase III [candidate division KSB1 bacterium]
MTTVPKRRDALPSLESSPVANGTAYVSSPLEIYGQNVFSLTTMRQMLPKQVYQHMLEIIEKGVPLDPATADVVAAAMKDWALSRGATHYSHWFHPLTGLTAEKHSAFLQPTRDGSVITEFTGENLLQGEPDASSFPSGGLRATFEARGYTGWDPTSNAFLMEGTLGKTLCIPSVFLGFGGHALDKKAPLLRSIDAISRAALRVLRLFGNRTASRVITTLGCEQEYFLIDRRYFLQRPDLITAGRTLFGARPAKGQEMEDHYFGAIKQRVLAYMEDLERELYKLGIPVTTRHNEVAPSQFELAPVFERANVATDHNMLVMSEMKRVAHKHGFECLLHEKPFAGINGSGKHNNWSMADDLGVNLLDPGRTPQENAQFLVFLTAVIRAVHSHADLLRASVATPANDHRLGANEAPPAIMSIYLGDVLTEVVESLIHGEPMSRREQQFLDIGVSTLPPLPMHDSDRNRTSPFAYTGSKFEFRAVGSGQNVARPNMVLNTIVAESLDAIAGQLEQALGQGKPLNEAVRAVVRAELTAHAAVVFNGDNYSAEWHAEAERRGLPNLKSCIEAIPVFVAPRTLELFGKVKVLSEDELRSRCRIMLENYVKTISIEAALTADLGRTSILPAALEYQQRMAASVQAMEHVVATPAKPQHHALKTLTAAIDRLLIALENQEDARKSAESNHGDELAHAAAYRNQVLPAMAETRAAGDALELLVDDRLWPLPKYRELLFSA